MYYLRRGRNEVGLGEYVLEMLVAERRGMVYVLLSGCEAVQQDAKELGLQSPSVCLH